MNNLRESISVRSRILRCLPKCIRPDILLNKVSDLDDKLIASLKDKYSIEAIILDIDETLRKDMKLIPEYNKRWLEHLKENIKVIVISNGYDKRIYNYLNSIGLQYVSLANKPFSNCYIQAAFDLNVSVNKILVVGDSLFYDILGGKRNGMLTALVKRI